MNSFRAVTMLLTIFAGSFDIWAQDKDDDLIKIDSSVVVLNAAVTDASGKAVQGLGQKQFNVFEDGVEQSIKSFDAENTPFAAAILLDASGSMSERIAMARAAAIEFLSGLRSDDYAAVYKFDSRVEMLQDFRNSHDLRDRIFDVKADGMTALNDAVYKAAVQLSSRPEKRRAIVVLSDGADTFSKKSADKALKAALLANAMIYTVDMSVPDTTGISREQNQGVLKGFAEKTGGRFIATPGGTSMREAFARIVAELGTQYSITYEPSNARKDGKWRSIELKISKPGLTIRTRKGYNAPKG